MTNVKKVVAACAGTIALACAVIQSAKAADLPPQYPQYPQYGEPPAVEPEPYVYQRPPQAYYQPAPPPVVYQEYAPPAVVPVPAPYYVPRRVYVAPGYRAYAYGYRPYIAGGGYGYRPWYNHQAYRRW